jgi:hypothetical protein
VVKGVGEDCFADAHVQPDAPTNALKICRTLLHPSLEFHLQREPFATTRHRLPPSQTPSFPTLSHPSTAKWREQRSQLAAQPQSRSVYTATAFASRVIELTNSKRRIELVERPPKRVKFTNTNRLENGNLEIDTTMSDSEWDGDGDPPIYFGRMIFNPSTEHAQKAKSELERKWQERHDRVMQRSVKVKKLQASKATAESSGPVNALSVAARSPPTALSTSSAKTKPITLRLKLGPADTNDSTTSTSTRATRVSRLTLHFGRSESERQTLIARQNVKTRAASITRRTQYHEMFVSSTESGAGDPDCNNCDDSGGMAPAPLKRAPVPSATSTQQTSNRAARSYRYELVSLFPTLKWGSRYTVLKDKSSNQVIKKADGTDRIIDQREDYLKISYRDKTTGFVETKDYTDKEPDWTDRRAVKKIRKTIQQWLRRVIGTTEEKDYYTEHDTNLIEAYIISHPEVKGKSGNGAARTTKAFKAFFDAFSENAGNQRTECALAAKLSRTIADIKVATDNK